MQLISVVLVLVLPRVSARGFFFKIFLNLFGIVQKVVRFAHTKTTKIKTMDLIYLILATPVAVAVSFIAWKFKQYKRDINNLPEARPYQYEKDEFIPHFDDYTQMLTQRRLKKN